MDGLCLDGVQLYASKHRLHEEALKLIAEALTIAETAFPGYNDTVCGVLSDFGVRLRVFRPLSACELPVISLVIAYASVVLHRMHVFTRAQTRLSTNTHTHARTLMQAH